MRFVCPVCGKEFSYYLEDGNYDDYLGSLITHAFEHLGEITRARMQKVKQ